jgi:hypothetical protein
MGACFTNEKKQEEIPQPNDPSAPKKVNGSRMEKVT